MDNISFTSRIRPVSLSEFHGVSGSIGAKGSVTYPWTIKQSVLGKDAFTTGVIDCTVCGITDGANVLLTHICPTVEGNMNFKRIESFIKSKLELMNKEYLQGFLLGSQGSEMFDSRKLYNHFSDMLDRLNIPTTKLRAGFSETNVAYLSNRDEWLVASEDVRALRTNLSPEQTINEMFERVELSPLDEIV